MRLAAYPPMAGIVSQLLNVSKNHYSRSALPALLSSSTAAGRISLVVDESAVAVGNRMVMVRNPVTLNLSSAASWDAVTPTDYTVAANRAGKDFYLYALADRSLVVSANATAPAGHTTADSRKIGGFHCLCVAVGTISGHTLTGFLAGDILPDSIWDITHLPICSPVGMVYAAQADIWVDIYLQSGTGETTASVNGATITDTRTWLDFVDDLAAVGKRLLWDAEFQIIAEGSNQKTNIVGSADPVTTTGHLDTAGRRMISNIGCEDCCGALYQWLLDTQFKIGGLVDPTVDPAYSWYTLPGNKGSIYRQGTGGDIKLLAGGPWNYGTACGSRCRAASGERWLTGTNLGSRGCARSRNT